MRTSDFKERRPLSARAPLWQSRAGSGSAGGMTRAVATALAPAIGFAAIALLAAPALAVPGGEIGTLERGRYVCELPGDALGPRGRHVPAEDFRVVHGSSYRADGKRGTYLLTGDQVVMTSGPRKGARFHRMSDGFLRRQNADGSDSELRCVMANRNNTMPF
jgi:hypothetical protein